MSISAIIPEPDLMAARAELEAQGYGARNFSVQIFNGPRPVYAVQNDGGAGANLGDSGGGAVDFNDEVGRLGGAGGAGVIIVRHTRTI